MYQGLLILHLLVMAAGIGMSMTMAMQGAAAAKLPPKDAERFMLQASRATILGPIAIVVMIATGLIMLVMHDGVAIAVGGWLFWVKMALVAVLSVFIAAAHVVGNRARASGQAADLAKAARFGMGAQLASILTVIIAVLAFRGW